MTVRILRSSTWLIFFVLTGCITSGPDYVAPELPIPDQWHAEAVAGLESGDHSLQTWWSVFDDPVLTELIERAHAENLSAQIALSRIDEARATLGIARGERVPDIDGDGAAQRTRLSEDTSPAVPPTRSRTDEFYQIGGDATWELDLWGRVRRSVESARGAHEATIEDYRDVLVGLYAEIARNYITARTLQERIRLANANVTAQRQSVELTRNRFDAGLVGMLDVRQAELNLASTEAAIPDFRAGYAAAVNRLATLLGEYPSVLHDELESGDSIPMAVAGAGTAVPSDILRQRPDIRAAERRLASQTARIGAQKALLYPTFVLSGSLTLEAYSSDNLLESGSRAYGFGPAVRWNLFDGGRIRNAVEVEEIRTEQLLLQYEQSVLVAVEEVETAMVALAQERERLEALTRASEAATESVELVRTLYLTGLADFQNLLDMQRTKFLQDDQYAESLGAVSSELVRLYTALGGGWSPAEMD